MNIDFDRNMLKLIRLFTFNALRNFDSKHMKHCEISYVFIITNASILKIFTTFGIKEPNIMDLSDRVCSRLRVVFLGSVEIIENRGCQFNNFMQNIF